MNDATPITMTGSGIGRTALALIFALGTAAPAFAATTYTGSVGIAYGPETSGTTDAPASYAVSDTGASGSVSLSDAHHGEIDSSVTTAGAAILASGIIKYVFQVAGDESTFVPVHVQAHGYAEGSGSFNGTANFKLFYSAPDDFPYNSILSDSADVYGYGPGHTLNYDEFEIDQWVMMWSNSNSIVEMYANAYADFYAGPGGTAHAFLDPIFTIDPAYASRFTITGLPGDASPPSGAVPEPASWAMMLAGFGLVGGAMRGRRTVAFSFG
jgi:hypothetical protein